MKKFPFMLLFMLYLYMNAVGQTQPKVTGIDIREYGIFRSEKKGTVEAKDTAKGQWTVIDNITQVVQTDSIPAAVGTEFGFWYMVNGEPAGETIQLTTLSIVPGIKNPQSRDTVYLESYVVSVKIAEKSYKGYVFEYDWEAVPGKWTFQLFYKDTKLAEKSFIVYK